VFGVLSDGAAPEPHHHHVVELAKLKPTLIRAALLLLETAVIPTLLLYACTVTVGSMWGLVAVFGWCALCVGARMTMRRRVPSMLLFAVCGLVGRTTFALVFSNMYVHLSLPTDLGLPCMAAPFLGSAAIGKAVTVPLARDFVALPAQLFHDRRVRPIFINVSLIWGVPRLIDVGMSVGSLHFGVDAGLLSRGLFSTLLTVATMALWAIWGWRQIQQVPGVTFKFA
jgi:hypothetical protein